MRSVKSEVVFPMPRRTRWILAAVLLGVATAIWLSFFRKPREVRPEPKALPTIASRLDQYGPAARARLRPLFEAANVPYPPPAMTWLALKAERRLEIYVPDRVGAT